MFSMPSLKRFVGSFMIKYLRLTPSLNIQLGTNYCMWKCHIPRVPHYTLQIASQVHHQCFVSGWALYIVLHCMEHVDSFLLYLRNLLNLLLFRYLCSQDPLSIRELRTITL